MALAQHIGTFNQTSRHGKQKCQGHIRRVFGQDIRRIGDGDSTLCGGRDVDIIHAIAEICDELEIGARLFDRSCIDDICDARHQNVRFLHRSDDFRLIHAVVVYIQTRIKQFPHSGFHWVRQFSRKNDQRFLLVRHLHPIVEQSPRNSPYCNQLAGHAPRNFLHISSGKPTPTFPENALTEASC